AKQTDMLFDGRTLQSIAALGGGFGGGAVALADGGAALVEADAADASRVLCVYGADGTPRLRIPLNSPLVRIVGEVAPGKIVAMLPPRDYEANKYKTRSVVIDTVRGVVEREEPGLVVADPASGSDPRGVAPNALQNLLVTDKQGT